MSLRVWLKDGHTVEVVRRSADDFTALTGVDVELHVVPEGEAHDRLLSGEERPDVVTVPYWYLDELAGRDLLRPLDDFVPAGDWERFPSAAVGALSRGGARWALPHTLTGGMLAYRTDLLEQAGHEPPRTTSQVLTLARELGSSDGPVHGLVARGSVEFSSLETYAGWAWAHGHRLLPRTGEPDPDVLQRAVGDLVETLRDTAPPDLTTRDYGAVGRLMQEGRALFLVDTSAWGFFLEDPTVSRVAGRVGYSVLHGPAAPVQFLYAEGLGITTWCTRPTEAAAFLAWRHSADIVRREVEEVGRLDLPRTDLWDTDWYRHEVRRRLLEDYMAVVRRSWEAADPAHVATRPDFVAQARRIMRSIVAVLERRAPDLTAALAATAPAGDHG
jgi:ABC-type glycerol-3-phosphate transport system substrate-binding protein